MNVPHLILSS